MDIVHVCERYELTIEQYKDMHALVMSQLKTKMTLEKDQEIEKLNIELSSKDADIERLKRELSSKDAEIERLKAETLAAKPTTFQNGASETDKDEFKKLVEKLLTWPYDRLIRNAEDLIEDIYYIVHTNAIECSYIDLQTENEVLRRKLKKRSKQSHVPQAVLVVGTKADQITEPASTSTSTGTVCNVKPPPFTVVKSRFTK